jgi:hypothetical protein
MRHLGASMLSRSALGEKPYVVSESIWTERTRLVRFGVNTNILRNTKQPCAVLAEASVNTDGRGLLSVTAVRSKPISKHLTMTPLIRIACATGSSNLLWIMS